MRRIRSCCSRWRNCSILWLLSSSLLFLFHLSFQFLALSSLLSQPGHIYAVYGNLPSAACTASFRTRPTTQQCLSPRVDPGLVRDRKLHVTAFCQSQVDEHAARFDVRKEVSCIEELHVFLFYSARPLPLPLPLADVPRACQHHRGCHQITTGH